MILKTLFKRSRPTRRKRVVRVAPKKVVFKKKQKPAPKQVSPTKRRIESIVIHHSATPRDADVQRSLASFNRNHTRLTVQGQSPSGHPMYPNIAYHYVIGSGGNLCPIRDHEQIGYHAANWPVNKTSIGICLIGNYDGEHPTHQAIDTLKTIIANLKEEHPIRFVAAHKQVSKRPTNCPGQNLVTKLLQENIISDVIQ